MILAKVVVVVVVVRGCSPGGLTHCLADCGVVFVAAAHAGHAPVRQRAFD